MSKPVNWDDFPAEVKLLILQKVPWKDLVRIRTVSHAFYHLLREVSKPQEEAAISIVRAISASKESLRVSQLRIVAVAKENSLMAFATLREDAACSVLLRFSSELRLIIRSYPELQLMLGCLAIHQAISKGYIHVACTLMQEFQVEWAKEVLEEAAYKSIAAGKPYTAQLIEANFGIKLDWGKPQQAINQAKDAERLNNVALSTTPRP
jgi:hypothetical protein